VENGSRRVTCFRVEPKWHSKRHGLTSFLLSQKVDILFPESHFLRLSFSWCFAITMEGPGVNQVQIMDYCQRFFGSSMWTDTIKDFVLANCNIFIGEDEFCQAHFDCHKKFCEIIENTLNIYLLDILKITFEEFQNACNIGARQKNQAASNVVQTLKQATDFKYFAAKMYAYNLMLDREAQSIFVLQGSTDKAFFQTFAPTTSYPRPLQSSGPPKPSQAPVAAPAKPSAKADPRPGPAVEPRVSPKEAPKEEPKPVAKEEP
jgi:hypothetical protein